MTTTGTASPFIFVLLILSWFIIEEAIASDYSPLAPTVNNAGGKNCERIQVPLCSDTPYNFTRMPNVLGNPDQHTAALTIDEYKALIDAQCSTNLKFFLCSMFTPMCSDAVDVAITSCRSVCDEVKTNCLPLLNSFGLQWPETLNCSQFPVKGPGSICMDPSPPTDGAGTGVDSAMNKNGVGKYNRQNVGSGGKGIAFLGGVNGQHAVNTADIGGSVSRLPTSSECFGTDQDKCRLECHKDWMFKKDSKEFAEIWMATWSVLCFVVTLFTVVTFCLDRSRFRYPERPIIFLSFCYNAYSFGYILRILLKADTVKCQRDKDDADKMWLVSGGLDNSSCVIVFMILYYFANACAIWWVVLSFTWFLAAARKWGQEAITSVSQFFHLAAWGVPALLTIAVMITHSVDASELTGLCYVGQLNSTALLGYIVGPMSLFLIIAVGFIGAGLMAMGRIRREMRHQHDRDTDLIKLEKLMVRVGIFSLLYSLPAVVVIGCCVYEYYYLNLWSSTPYCKSYDPTAGDCREWSQPRPRAEIYMLKIFMSLVVGTTCGMWVVSRKTFAKWRRFMTCGLLESPGAKFVAYRPSGGGTTATSALTLPVPSSTLPPQTVPLMASKKYQTTSTTNSSSVRYGGFRSGGSESSAKL